MCFGSLQTGMSLIKRAFLSFGCSPRGTITSSTTNPCQELAQPDTNSECTLHRGLVLHQKLQGQDEIQGQSID